ncbi:MAG: hypothetical protein RIS24_975 [Verrucomicrobiota bacterium]
MSSCRSFSRTPEWASPVALLLAVILVALVFEYINGFHDTANSTATGGNPSAILRMSVAIAEAQRPLKEAVPHWHHLGWCR